MHDLRSKPRGWWFVVGGLALAIAGIALVVALVIPR